MRLFIGLELPEALKTEISSFQTQLREDFTRGSWKARDNFHLTLKFLGEVAPSDYPRVCQALEHVALMAYNRRFKTFQLSLGGLGVFGLGKENAKGHIPIRVLWLGMASNPDCDLASLQLLHQWVEDAFFKVGFPRDFRPYAPHITLAQDTQAVVPFDLKKWQQLEQSLNQPFSCSSLSLFISEPIPHQKGEQGRRYRVLETRSIARNI